MTKLIIYEEIAGEATVFEDFELTTSRILVGSSSDNQLVLDAPGIDPAHASLELRFDHWVLQDLGAPGGTMVNGHIVDGPYHLQHDDLIELGSVKMKFHDFPLEVETNSESPTEPSVEVESNSHQVSGQIWFVKVAIGTVIIIFIILLILIFGHYWGLLNVSDLLPPWLLRANP